jgi:hypothetical protein
MDRQFFASLVTAAIGFVVVATIAVTLLEEDKRSWRASAARSTGPWAAEAANPEGIVTGSSAAP